ncbi:MAG: ankyrin repeat domain-containing protein, partial [Verrucomicrobiota bacterium]
MRYADAENTFYVEAENVAFVAEGDSTSKTTKEQTPESSPSLKSPVNLREVQLNQEKYIDKEISVEGILSLSTYFNYGYSDLNGNVRQTHYAFRLEANETEANLYWRKSEAESVKDALVAAEKQGVKSLSAKVVFVIRKDRYEQTDDIYAEIVRAEAIRPGSTAEDYQPFFDAAKHGDFGSIRRFLSAPSSSLSLRSDVNAIDNDGKTALMLAIEASHDSVVRTLLAHGANPTIKAKNGQTAEELAAAGNHAATIALVRTALSLRGKAPTRPLVNLREVQLNQGKYIDKEVTANGNISLSTYFNYGYSDNESNARKTHYSFRLKSDDVEANLYWTKSAAQVVNNALIKAEAQGLKDIPASVTFMIRKDRYQPTDDIFAEVIGIDLYSESSAGVEDNLNAQLYRAFDYEGQLFAACKDGNRAAVNEAIAKGAVVDACTDDGNTALMAAAANGHADIIKDLITAHASVNKITPDGNTPLMLAAWEGKPEAIKELIAAGAKPDAKKPDGKTAMHLAVFQGHTDAVNALLESKANIDLQDSELYTPLMVAVDKERVDIFQLLLDHGARQSITNRQGNSALHLASSIKNPAIAKLLLEKGASVNLQNIKLETPLLIAANNWNKEVVVLLLEHDADVNIQDKDGTSPANNSRLWDVAPEIAGLIKKAASNHQAKPIEVGHDNAAMTNRKSADQNLVDEMKAAPVSVTVAQDRNYDQSVFLESESYLRLEPRTPFVHLANERLFRRHQFSVLLGGLLQYRGVGQDGGSPSLEELLGGDFSEERETLFIADCEKYFTTEEGRARLREAQEMGNDLAASLRVEDAILTQEFLAQLRECAAWYGERWRYYHGRFQETSGDIQRAGENHFWANQAQKWQEQLIIQHFPRLGFLPTYSFPVNSVQLEVLSGNKPN